MPDHLQQSTLGAGVVAVPAAGFDGAVLVTRPAVCSSEPDRARSGSTWAGPAWGLLGVLGFSFTVPLTSVALNELSPLLISAGRAVVAAGLAAIALAWTRQALPHRSLWPRLAIVAAGVVIGFPFLVSYALVSTPASHGAVVIGLLPAATAVAAVLRIGDRPSPSFWVFSALGAAAAVVFASLGGDGLGQLHVADLLLFGAVIAAAVGYAEGAVLARELGSWQTVSWALLLAAPTMAILTGWSVVQSPPQASAGAWSAFGYLAVVSTFLAFFAWYRGLALGPLTQVSQVQLVQPVLSLIWATALLGESVTVMTALGGLAVIACAGLTVGVRRPRRHPSVPNRQTDDCGGGRAAVR